MGKRRRLDAVLLDRGNCDAQETQVASNGVISSRYHIRLHTTGYDDIMGWTSVGDAHHEDLVSCGHAVDPDYDTGGSGFIQGRHEAWYGFTHVAPVHTEWMKVFWGNSEEFTQCNGKNASNSDGNVIWMHIHEGYHTSP